ncbi:MULTISPECIES: hypothetical protein [unclassified Amycolatopsis]|uniref:hypothetical protein n=1 Tax=unclassified Amycolatopsis TaxID=2618356 RepID=UPI002875CD60|nr:MULTISPECIES: hypothetical protein [unclassified Amycolatopsis]MDS0132072.1 hypothetical protein [Amycolatopsis sp. 505]MDS0141190.1 hypothetical protein [Amycolatopsis sp. CM201R]
MARTGGEGELPSVAELVNLSQTKPLMIRGELDAKLAEEAAATEPDPTPDPLAILDAELAADDAEDSRPQEAPPADRTRRAKPYVLAAGAAVGLGLAAVVLLQPHQVGGTAVPPPGAPAPVVPPPTSSEAVETMSASAAPPPLTAEVRHSTAETTSAPAGAGRKPARADAPTPTSGSPEDQWREYVSSVMSSWQQQHPRGGRNR